MVTGRMRFDAERRKKRREERSGGCGVVDVDWIGTHHDGERDADWTTTVGRLEWAKISVWAYLAHSVIHGMGGSFAIWTVESRLSLPNVHTST